MRALFLGGVPLSVCDSMAVGAGAKVKWRAVGAAATGRKHQGLGRQGQDAVFARTKSANSVVVVCDGAGSAANAMMGARTIAEGVGQFLLRRAARLANQDATAQRAQIAACVQRLVSRTASRAGIPEASLASTLLFAVARGRFVLLGQVGDGAVLVRRPRALGWLRLPLATRGEHAGETVFATHPNMGDYLHLACLDDVDGLMLMSDGAESSLVKRANGEVSPAVAKMAGWVRHESLSRARKALRVAAEQTLVQRTLDDVGLAVMVQTAALPAAGPEAGDVKTRLGS